MSPETYVKSHGGHSGYGDFNIGTKVFWRPDDRGRLSKDVVIGYYRYEPGNPKRRCFLVDPGPYVSFISCMKIVNEIS